MYYIEDENFVIIPLSFVIFYRASLENEGRVRFANEFSISDSLFGELKELIKEKGTKKIVAIDFDRVTYPSKILEELKNFEEKVIFFNIHGEILRNKIKENLPLLNWGEKEDICFLNGIITGNIIEAYKNKFSFIYKEMYAAILCDIKDPCEQNTPYPLESSGLYSNMYINVKKLFLDTRAYYLVLYGMAIEAHRMGEFDGFISSSKNGALLAAMLGAMLNKKSVYIQGVGPKYSMKFGNIQNEIKRGKSYIYIFDFVCTGTELKVISALINSNDAYLNGGIGFAQYDDSEKQKMFMNDKIRCLITTEEANLKYILAGNKGDILKLMSILK